MKLWRYLALIIFVLGVGIFSVMYWIRQDDVLSPEALGHIKVDLAYDASLKQHAYFLFLGLNARDEVDPHQLGRYRYHREWANFFRAPNADVLNQIDTGLDASMQRHALDAQDRERLRELQAAFSDQQHLDAFLKAHKLDLQRLIQTERVPLQRLQQLLEQDAYISLLMHPQSIYPDYGYILDLQRLSLANQLLNQATLDSYHRQFQSLHQFTQNRLSVVEKMMMQNWMSQLIDVMREAQRHDAKRLYLEPLTTDQLSLVSSLEHELGTQYVYLKRLPSSFPHGQTMSQWLFLPNRTFNKVVQNYQRYFDFSELSYRDLELKLGQQSAAEPQSWTLKNSYGEIIAGLKPPNFEKYLLMTHVLNNKILAFNAVNERQLNVAELNRNAEGRYYYVKDAKLCIEIPYPLQQRAELNLKIDSCVVI